MKGTPNIVLIITDQQRADTIGAWGHPHMITPHLGAYPI
jgi:arylsulfatase A-like enzyme